MAKGSEQFTWKLYPGVPRECAVCGGKLRRDDVGRVHTVYDYGDGFGVATTVFFCVACER